MATPFDALDDSFYVNRDENGEIIPSDKGKLSKEPASQKKKDRAEDYEYARAHLRLMIDKMQESLNGAMEVADQSDHPRAYEVVFAGAKHTADILDKLHQLHKREKELDKEDTIKQEGGQTNNGTVNNVFMTGSTSDLLKMLKDSQLEDAEDK